jgi:phage terminase Nu1 subunit (DNA packaging protein)
MTEEKKKKQAKETKRTVVGTAILSEDFGVTKRRIQQLVEEGVLTATKDSSGYKFDYRRAVAQYVKYLDEKSKGKDKTSEYSVLEQEKLQAEVTIKKSRATVAGMELAEYEGSMHRTEDVEEMTSRLIYAIRSAFVSFPSRLSVDVAKITKPAAVSRRIKTEVNEVLQELSQFEYDPSDYHEKVKERQGWQNDIQVKDDDAS